MDFTCTRSDGYLEHHGILGQKWGVRRFQNPDGSYTAAGKKHREITTKEVTAARGISNISKNTVDYFSSKLGKPKEKPRKDLSHLSNKDLQDIITRENLERQYNSMFNSEVPKGQKVAKNILEVAGATLTVASSALGIALAVKQLKNG